MSTFGVDYSAGVPSVASLKAAGVQFVARYISPGARRKNLTRAEADAMRAGGINVVTVYEDTIGDAKGGRPAGRANAAFAADELAHLGAPAGAPCYVAVDYDAQGAEVTMAVDYVRGAADVLGVAATGVYGGYRIVKACLDLGVCAYAWQTAAWSGGVWHPGAHIQQHLVQVTIGGVTCDRNFATQADYGQWDREEPDMPLTDEEIDKIAARVEARLKPRIDAAVSLLYRGDAGSPETHPANLEQIQKDVRAIAPTLTDAQAELIGAKVAITGHPSYTTAGPVELVPKEPPV